MPVRLNFSSAWDREKSLIFLSKFDENLKKRKNIRFAIRRSVSEAISQNSQNCEVISSAISLSARAGQAEPENKKIEKTCFWGARARPSPAGAAAAFSRRRNTLPPCGARAAARSCGGLAPPAGAMV